jgi:hypothetical protein
LNVHGSAATLAPTSLIINWWGSVAPSVLLRSLGPIILRRNILSAQILERAVVTRRLNAVVGQALVTHAILLVLVIELMDLRFLALPLG